MPGRTVESYNLEGGQMVNENPFPGIQLVRPFE